LLEAAVAGDGDRAAFVATGDEREEQVGCLALEWQVADFVDDEQVVALEPAQLLLELVAVLGRLEPADPFLCGGEGDPVAVLAGLEGKRDREVGLAGAGRAEEADVGTFLDPGELPRCMTSGFSAAGCAVLTVGIAGTTRRSRVARLTPSACAACSR